MSAHSPEPWTYDATTESLYDVNGDHIADMSLPRQHANGHRIAALAQENARLREALAGCLEALELIGYMRDNGEYQTSGQILIHGDQREDCGRAVLTARTALRAGGAEKGVWT